MISESGKQLLLFGEWEKWYVKGDKLVIKNGLIPGRSLAGFNIQIMELLGRGYMLMPNHKSYKNLGLCKNYRIKITGKLPDVQNIFTLGRPRGYYSITADDTCTGRGNALFRTFDFSSESGHVST